MKVLDLQCAGGHTFEGWFASEEDFLAQCEKSMVQCPVCGEASVQKKLSAPRLNLSHSRTDLSAEMEVLNAPQHQAAITAAWMEMARKIVANTHDVGEQFAEEARKMHYGEAKDRPIRGKTSVDEARALVEEGIEIVPLILPPSMKETLQ